MTLADPPLPPSMEFSIIDFFLNPSLIYVVNAHIRKAKSLKMIHLTSDYLRFFVVQAVCEKYQKIKLCMERRIDKINQAKIGLEPAD